MSAISYFLSYPTAEGYSDFIEITDDILSSSAGNIKQNLEANEYDVGKITFDNTKIVLRNEHSAYSEAINPSSIFEYKRDETIIKIEWNFNTYGIACGDPECGNTFLSNPRVLFKGMIEDNSTSFDVKSQTITFKILSLDSIINKVETPYSDLLITDDAETLVYKILNQQKITQFFNVETANISLPNNFTADDIISLEGTNCLEALQDILTMANGIMYVKDDICHVRSRTPDVDSSFIFYGPSSDEGIENIENISSYSTGLNRCFNYWFWEDDNVNINQSFSDSISFHGERRKGLFSKLITDTGKITAVLTSYLFEFGFPATELTLTAPMYTPIVDLEFLNKVNIDYPSDVLPIANDSTTRYAQSRYGDGPDGGIYARTINSLFISSDQNWKILNININQKGQKVTFKLREVL